MNNAKETKAEITTSTADVVETAKSFLPTIDKKKDSLLGSGRARNAGFGALGAVLMTGNILLMTPDVDMKTVLVNLGVSGVVGAASGALVANETTPLIDGAMAFSLGMTTGMLLTPLIVAGVEAGIGAVGDWRDERAQAKVDAEEFAKIQTEMNAILNQNVQVELPAIA